MKSFFRDLQFLEEAILSSKKYSDETKSVLKKLIAFTEDGILAVSDSQRFLCKNFRVSNIKKLHREWQILHGADTYKNGKPCKPKSEKCIRAQRSIISAKYEKHFSDLDEIFVTQDMERLRSLSQRIDFLRQGASTFDELFLSEVVECAMRCEVDDALAFEPEELVDELNVLSALYRSGVLAKLQKLDTQHLAYIRRVMNEPLSNKDGSFNMRKEAILRVLGESRVSSADAMDIAPELYKVLGAVSIEGVEHESDPKRINKLVQLMGMLTPKGLKGWLSDRNYDSKEIQTAMRLFLDRRV